jgi:putative FmdB family regulatory protein
VPTYDYQCRSCGTITEVIHAMTADGPTVCEHCGGELRRVLYPAGIIFKGSGFYRTDSRAASGTAGSSGATGASGSTGSGANVSPSGGDGTGSSPATTSSAGSTEAGGSKTSSSGSGGESAA